MYLVVSGVSSKQRNKRAKKKQEAWPSPQTYTQLLLCVPALSNDRLIKSTALRKEANGEQKNNH